MHATLLLCAALFAVGGGDDCAVGGAGAIKGAGVVSLLQLGLDVASVPPRGPGAERPPSPEAPATPPQVQPPFSQAPPRVPARPPRSSDGSVLPESWVWDQLRAQPPAQKPTVLATKVQEPILDGEAGKPKYEFMHIPKNAGSAVEGAGKAAGISWGAYNEALKEAQMDMPDGSLCSRWHVPGPVLAEPNPYKDATEVFCVTRHPYNKLVSEYTWRVAKGYLPDWGTGGYEECSEEGLNYYLQYMMLEVEIRKPFIQDCHFVPQSDFIRDANTGEGWCSNVLRYDDLPTAFSGLMKKWDLPVTLEAQINSSGPHCPDLSTSSLTADTRLLIQRVYKADFELLDYDPDLVY